MRLRRCAIVHVEPRERLEFDLADLAQGGSGLRDVLEWVALGPQLSEPVVLTAAEVAALGEISPSQWRERDALSAQHSQPLVDALQVKGLLVAEDSAAASADAKAQATHWRSASAVMHYASRWRGIDASEAQKQFAETD